MANGRGTAPRRTSLLQRLLSPHSPARVIATAFIVGVGITTAILMLPIASRDRGVAPFRDALFYATSSVCVTGLSLGDIAAQWSTFGQVVIIAAVQLGGFGITALASLLALLVSRRLGLSTRLFAQAETGTLGLGDVRRVLFGVAILNIVVEGTLAVVLWLRLWLGYGEGMGRAAYLGVFHAIAAFNNAGYALWPDNLVSFATDPLITLPILLGVFLGALGFPVIFELRRELLRPRTWSVHTNLTVLGTVILVIVGSTVITAYEWGNKATLGAFDVRGRILNGVFAGVIPRSGGFNTIDYAQATDSTRFVTDILMFIGGGPASTAGGIKLTTFMLLFFAILAEARGDRDINVVSRRVPFNVVRQCISVALLGVAIVVAGVMAMLALTDLTLDTAIFEVTSAFSSTGLSTGVLPGLPASAHYVLTALMFVGRLGTITLASALALRDRPRFYRLPEERPIIG